MFYKHNIPGTIFFNFIFGGCRFSPADPPPFPLLLFDCIHTNHNKLHLSFSTKVSAYIYKTQKMQTWTFIWSKQKHSTAKKYECLHYTYVLVNIELNMKQENIQLTYRIIVPIWTKTLWWKPYWLLWVDNVVTCNMY